MFTPSTGAKIFVHTEVTDMRKGFSGLSAIIREAFKADPTDGSLFVFINRRRDRMKLLQFSDGGFWLFYRLLESGTFESLWSSPSEVYSLLSMKNELSAKAFALWLHQPRCLRCRPCFRHRRSPSSLARMLRERPTADSNEGDISKAN